MEVIILCGGQGTRLREETEYRPKPMVEVGGRPILWHIMKMYAHHGISDFVLCLGYRGFMIKEYFLNYEAMNNDLTVTLGSANHVEYHGAHEEQEFRVTLAETGLDTMTGGRVRRARKYVSGDTFMVTYGDGLSDVNVTDLLDFHASHGKIGTVTTVHPVSRFGEIDITSDRRVNQFVEKPQASNWVSAGFFVFEKEFFDFLNDDPSLVLERTPLERLAAEGELMAYQHDGFFYAMDTYREYLHLNKLWDSGKAPWRTWR